MAYDGSKLHALLDSIGGGSVRAYFYGPTEDTFETITGAGYISDGAKRGMRVHDIVHVYGTTPETGRELNVSAVHDDGSVTLVDPGFISLTDTASQPEAEAGAVNNKLMTPLRTKQHVDSRRVTDVDDETEEKIVTAAYYKRFGPRDLEWFGSGTAIKGGTTADATALFQAAVESGKDVTITRRYYVEDEISIPAGARVSMRGYGRRFAEIYVPPIGAAKKLLKFPNSAADRSSSRNYLGYLRIIGINDSGAVVQHKEHPIGVYMPCSTDDALEFVEGFLGNTPFWFGQAFNLRCRNLLAYGSGYAPLRVESAALTASRFTIAVNTNTVSVASGSFAFTSDHVGLNCYIYDSSGRSLAGTIISQTGTAAVLDLATRNGVSPRTFTSALLSFELVKGTITGTTLILDTDCLTSADEDRFVYIEGAGPNGGLHVTTLTSVTNGTTAEVALAAKTSVVSPRFVHFTPTGFCGTPTDASGGNPNDAMFLQCHFENCFGPEWVFTDGTRIWVDTNKTHGLGGTNSSGGRMARHYIFHSQRQARVVGSELSHGFSKDRGTIAIMGSRSDVTFDSVVHGSSYGQPIFDLDSNDADSTRLNIGNNCLQMDPDLAPHFIRFGASMTEKNVIEFAPNRANGGGGAEAKSYRYNKYGIRQRAREAGIYTPDTAYAVAAMQVSAPAIVRARTDLYAALLGGVADIGVNLDALWVFMCHGADAGCVNIINPDKYNLVPVSAPAFTADEGFTGDGANDYLRTGFIPILGVTHYQQDSACFGFVSRTAGAAAGSSNYDMGVVSAVSAVTANLRARTNSDAVGYTINDGTVGSAASTDGSGFFNVIRTASNARKVRNANSDLATGSQASTGLPTAELHILGANGSGSRSARQLSFAWVGAGMTDSESNDFAALLEDYETGIAGL